MCAEVYRASIKIITAKFGICGSAYENGCVVDGTCATAAYCVLLLLTAKC